MTDTYTFTFEASLDIDFEELTDNILEDIDSYVNQVFDNKFYFSLSDQECTNYDEILQEVTKKVAKKLLESVDK